MFKLIVCALLLQFGCAKTKWISAEHFESPEAAAHIHARAAGYDSVTIVDTLTLYKIEMRRK